MNSKKHTLNIQAHRIFGNESAANSEQSFTKAIASGIKSIETDVFLSRDGVMISIHGDDENGSCEVRLKDRLDAPWQHLIIGDLTAKEIDGLTYRHSEGHNILRLEQIIDAFKDSDIVINVEIKDFDPKITGMVVDAFNNAGMIDRLFVSSFFHYHRKHLRQYLEMKNLPHVAFGFLSYSIYHLASDEVMMQTMPGDSITVSQAGLRLHIGGYPDLFKKVKDRGLKMNVWFDGLNSATLETLFNYKSLADLGIDTIITNYPSKALEYQKLIQAESDNSHTNNLVSAPLLS